MRPHFLGKIIYFFGYPIFRIFIKNTTRAYVILQVGDEVLLTQNWLGFQKKWRLPGGGVKHGEQPVIAAQRELYEELGIAIHEQNLESVSSRPFRAAANYDYYLFTLRLPEKPAFVTDKREILSAEYKAITTLTTLHISEEVTSYLSLARTQ